MSDTKIKNLTPSKQFVYKKHIDILSFDSTAFGHDVISKLGFDAILALASFEKFHLWF